MSQGLRQMEKWIVRRFGVVLLITGTIISLVFGYLGFSKLGAVGGYDLSGWDRIYLTLQLFIGQSGYLATPIPWELEVARFLAPLAVARRRVLVLLGLRARGCLVVRVRPVGMDGIDLPVAITVGLEGEQGAIGRPGRSPIFGGIIGEVHQVRAIRLDQIDISLTVMMGAEGDLAAIR